MRKALELGVVLSIAYLFLVKPLPTAQENFPAKESAPPHFLQVLSASVVPTLAKNQQPVKAEPPEENPPIKLFTTDTLPELKKRDLASVEDEKTYHRRVLAANPEDIRLRREHADFLLREGQHEEALRILRETLKKDNREHWAKHLREVEQFVEDSKPLKEMGLELFAPLMPLEDLTLPELNPSDAAKARKTNEETTFKLRERYKPFLISPQYEPPQEELTKIYLCRRYGYANLIEDGDRAFRELNQTFPNSPRARAEFAGFLMEAKKLDEASSLLIQGIKEYPLDARLRVLNDILNDKTIPPDSMFLEISYRFGLLDLH